MIRSVRMVKLDSFTKSLHKGFFSVSGHAIYSDHGNNIDQPITGLSLQIGPAYKSGVWPLNAWRNPIMQTISWKVVNVSPLIGYTTPEIKLTILITILFEDALASQGIAICLSLLSIGMFFLHISNSLYWWFCLLSCWREFINLLL